MIRWYVRVHLQINILDSYAQCMYIVYMYWILWCLVHACTCTMYMYMAASCYMCKFIIMHIIINYGVDIFEFTCTCTCTFVAVYVCCATCIICVIPVYSMHIALCCLVALCVCIVYPLSDFVKYLDQGGWVKVSTVTVSGVLRLCKVVPTCSWTLFTSTPYPWPWTQRVEP